MSESCYHTKPLQFRGRTLFAFVLMVELPVNRWLSRADEWISNSPGFFDGRPVVLDVSSVLISERKISDLVAGLDSRGIRVMAIVGAQQSTLAPNLPPLLTTTQASLNLTKASHDEDRCASGDISDANWEVLSPLVIEAPVRSGQSVFHRGDVTVFGSVSSGAEIVATGSIDVYGTLRGSVLAGAEGNEKAHIYCQRLEAELLSICGYYSTADGMDDHLMKRAIHARLQRELLEIRALN